MKSYAAFTDEQLISLIKQNDKLALGELYDRYYKKVYQKCFSFVKDHDEAFDLAEESLMRAFEKLATFKGLSTYSTWLFTITHRTCLAYLRKKDRTYLPSEEYDLERLEELENKINDGSDNDEKLSIMLTLIDHLPEQERQLLLMKYYEGASIESLQSMLHISSSAVKMRLKRSKEKLNYLYAIALSYGIATALTLL